VEVSVDHATVEASPASAKPTRLRPLARAGLLAALTLLTALVALEIGFRLIPQAIPLDACRSQPTLGEIYCQYYYQYDRPIRLGYIYKPGYVLEGPWNPADPALVGVEDETRPTGRDDTFYYSLHVDDVGFVNPTPWQAHYDIVITGDSFTMPSAPVSWIDLLRQRTGMSVLNLGMTGWGTLAEVEAVRMYGLDKSPRRVMLLYFEGNDLFNVEEYHRRRESGLDWHTYELRSAAPLDRLVLPHMLRYWSSLTRRRPQVTEYRYPMSVTTNTGQFETIPFDVNISALSADRDSIEASDAWALATQAILDLHDEVTAQGGRFLLVYIPAKEHLYWGRLWDERDIGHVLERTTPLRSYEEFSAHIDDQVLLMEEFAAANDIEILNLTGRFWLETMDGAELYNYADTHWNEAGNRLAAQLIADYVEQHE
jgi:hypothetical protein